MYVKSLKKERSKSYEFLNQSSQYKSSAIDEEKRAIEKIIQRQVFKCYISRNKIFSVGLRMNLK
jgi:hypothetical protein